MSVTTMMEQAWVLDEDDGEGREPAGVEAAISADARLTDAQT